MQGEGIYSCVSNTIKAHSMIMVLDSVWGLYVAAKSNFPHQTVQDWSLYSWCRFIRTALKLCFTLLPHRHAGRPSQKVALVFSLHLMSASLPTSNGFPRHSSVEIRTRYLHQVVRQSAYLHPQLGATELLFLTTARNILLLTPMSHCRLCTQLEQNRVCSSPLPPTS